MMKTATEAYAALSGADQRMLDALVFDGCAGLAVEALRALGAAIGATDRLDVEQIVGELALRVARVTPRRAVLMRLCDSIAWCDVGAREEIVDVVN